MRAPRGAFTHSGRAACALATAALLAGCGSKTSPAPSASILDGPVQKVSYGEVKGAVDDLYRRHPAVRSFVVRDVVYTPKTRDKVLSVCRSGGPEADPVAFESAKVLACAPLIFFFYSYGRQASVPESVDVARKLYWYAATNIRGPFDARVSLTKILRPWGIR